MIKYYIIACIWLHLICYSKAQKAAELLPWIDADELYLGMSIDMFKQLKPNAKSLTQGFVHEQEGKFSGVYYEGTINEEGKAMTDIVGFRFTSGLLTGLVWEDSNYSWEEKTEKGGRMSRVTKEIRDKLIKLHGPSDNRQVVQIQFEEITKNEAIVKIACDLFEVNDGKHLKITLTASATGIRAAVLELSEEEMNDFFSVEKDVTLFKAKGLKELRGEAIVDHLEFIRKSSEKEGGKEAKKLEYEGEGIIITNVQSESLVAGGVTEEAIIKEEGGHILIVAGVIISAGLFALLFLIKRKSGMNRADR